MRDVLVFQGKLVADAFRDLVLSPVSLVAAAISLLRDGREPGRLFYDVLYFGRRSERWINLFGDSRRVPPPSWSDVEGHGAPDPDSVDSLLDRLDEMVKRQYERGGITATAKDAIDTAIDRVHERIHRRGPSDAQPK